jgi:transcriptional regulator with XRE-family HTH domain
MGAIRDQLKQLRAAQGLSQKAAAKRANIAQQMWSKLEIGTASAEDSVSIYKIAEAFDMQVEAEGESLVLVPKHERGLGVAEERPVYGVRPAPPRPDEFLIPRLALGGSMGQGIEAPEHIDIVNQVRVNLPHLRREVSISAPSNLRILTGYGDSMEPTFKDGDPLLVDTGVTEIKIDGVYVLERDAGSDRKELFIKRVQRHPIDNTLIISSDNKNYQPVVVSESDRRVRFKVAGRVLLAWNSRKI